jgi:HEAT repeat protein
MYPHERSLVERLADKPFVLVGINSDSKERLREAKERENISWRSFWDGGSTGGPIARAWGVRGWPTIFVIDDQGIIRHKNIRGEKLDGTLDELLERAIVTLVKNVQSDDPQVRGLAAFRMGKYQAPDAKKTLAELLADETPSVRWRAATGLTLLGEPAKPLLALLKEAVQDEIAEVRVGSLTGLRQTGPRQAGDKELATVVIKALEDQEVAVRLAAIETLGAFQNPLAAPALARITKDQDPEVGKAAALALASLGAQESAKLLKELAEDPQHPAKVWIAVAMQRIKEPGAQERFEHFLNDDDVKIRRAAVMALLELGDFDPTDLYILALQDEDGAVWRASRTALSESGSERAIEALNKNIADRIEKLLPLLSTSDFSKERRILDQLRDLGPPAAPILFEKLGELPQRPQYALSRIIAQMRSPEVLERVLKKLSDSELDPSMRRYCEGIVRYVREKARTGVNDLAGHDDARVRVSGMHLMLLYDDQQAIDALHKALEDESPLVRVNAAAGLARKQDPQALAVLKELMELDDFEVLGLAIVSLSRYDPETAMPLLIELTNHGHHRVLRATIRSLGNFEASEATEAIVEVARKNPSLIRAATAALRRQKTPASALALGEFLGDRDPKVQQMARLMLQAMRIPEAKKVLEEYAQEEQERKEQEAKRESESKDAEKAEKS